MFLAAPKPPLFIGEGERGPAPSRSHLEGRGGGQEGETCPPSKVEAPPPLGFSTLGALGPWEGRTSPLGAGSLPYSAHQVHRGRWHHLVDLRTPFGGPGTIPITPETIPVTETGLPIYKSSPPDHSRTPRDVRDLIRDSKQHSVTTYYFHNNYSVTKP